MIDPGGLIADCEALSILPADPDALTAMADLARDRTSMRAVGRREEPAVDAIAADHGLDPSRVARGILALHNLALQHRVDPQAVAALAAGRDLTNEIAGRAVVGLLVLGPTLDDARAWATDPPSEDQRRVLYALRDLPADVTATLLDPTPAPWFQARRT